jgi:hypothetical protein
VRLRRIKAGHYRTLDGRYDIRRFRSKAFVGARPGNPDGWAVDQGWEVAYAPDALGPKNLGSLPYESFNTKAEAVVALLGWIREGRGE